MIIFFRGKKDNNFGYLQVYLSSVYREYNFQISGGEIECEYLLN